jgi:hypothetical protein
MKKEEKRILAWEGRANKSAEIIKWTMTYLYRMPMHWEDFFMFSCCNVQLWGVKVKLIVIYEVEIFLSIPIDNFVIFCVEAC